MLTVIVKRFVALGFDENSIGVHNSKKIKKIKDYLNFETDKDLEHVYMLSDS